MKLTASLILLLLLSGCASQPSVPIVPMPPAQPVAMIGTSRDSVAPTPQFLHLTWTENYVAGFTNEETEIDESTDLVNWATCFTGATNQCWIQEVYPFAFYRASNFLP